MVKAGSHNTASNILTFLPGRMRLKSGGVRRQSTPWWNGRRVRTVWWSTVMDGRFSSTRTAPSLASTLDTKKGMTETQSSVRAGARKPTPRWPTPPWAPSIHLHKETRRTMGVTLRLGPEWTLPTSASINSCIRESDWVWNAHCPLTGGHRCSQANPPSSSIQAHKVMWLEPGSVPLFSCSALTLGWCCKCNTAAI